MRDSKLSDLNQTDRICLWADWLSGNTSDALTREIAADLARRDGLILGALEEIEAASDALSPGIPTPKKRFSWLIPAIGIAASIVIAFALFIAWSNSKQDKIIVQQPNPKASPDPPIIVKKNSTKSNPPNEPQNSVALGTKPQKFKTAIASLEKLASSDFDPKEWHSSYDALLNEFPEHKAEIEGNKTLATALKRATAVNMVKQPDPPTPESDPNLKTLLAKIDEFRDEPLDIDDLKVRDWHNKAAQYRDAHPNTKIVKLDKFIIDSEATPQKRIQFAESQVQAVVKAAKDSAQVREFRRRVIALQLADESRPLALSSKLLSEAMRVTQLDTPAAQSDEQITKVAALVDRLSKPDKRNPYLFCVLPEGLVQGDRGIRGEAMDLYKNIQTASIRTGRLPEPSLIDYVTRSRRPIAKDKIGMIIRMSEITGDQNKYPDAKMSGVWGDVLALGGRGVSIKVVISPTRDGEEATVTAYGPFIKAAHDKQIEVLGLVSWLGDPEDQAVRWQKRFPNMIDGLFFTDQPIDLKMIPIYERLYRNARQFVAAERNALGLNEWQIVAFFGGPCEEAFLAKTGANIICINFPDRPKAEGWYAKYDPNRFGAMVKEVADPKLVDDILMDAAERHFGWVFVRVSNPSRTMPETLKQELAWIQEMNKRILPGNEEAAEQPVNPGTPKSKTKKSAAPNRK